MNPITFDEQNFVYTKPADMTDEGCSSLPVWRGVTKEGHPSIISKWKLSPEELEEVNRTGCVYLSIVSNVQPPVSVFTAYPFYYPEEVKEDA